MTAVRLVRRAACSCGVEVLRGFDASGRVLLLIPVSAYRVGPQFDDEVAVEAVPGEVYAEHECGDRNRAVRRKLAQKVSPR